VDAATRPTGPEPYHPPLGPIGILHRDEMLLVVDKPQGLLSVPGKAPGAADCLIARLHRMDAQTRLVHRLDRDTSGVMVFARSPRAQRHLGRQFERRQVQKRYIARVTGHLEGAGEVDLPLTADWPNRPRQMVSLERGRPAVTRWEAIGHEGDTTRVALAPLTGRSHQLRVHMAQLGHPILGDPLYGPLHGGAAAARLMLHAERLVIRHPDGGAPVSFRHAAPF
jgi:tRNA pseudouridine32 synthase/23S rRNA pseudouridine746 synthase